MGFLKRLITEAATKAIKAGLEYCVTAAVDLKERERRKLVDELSKVLQIPVDKIRFEVVVYPGGECRSSLTLDCAVSQKQLAEAQRFLDNLGQVRQNVRTPVPSVN